MDRTKYFKARGTDLRKKDNRVTGRGSTWVVGEIWELHHQIKRRVFLGEKNVQIAAALNCSVVTVSNVRNSPVIKRELELMHGAKDTETIDLGKRIEKLADSAYNNLENIIKNGEISGKVASIGLIAKESNSMMDRAGWGAPKKLQMESVHTYLTSDDIKEIKERARQGGAMINITSSGERSEQGRNSQEADSSNSVIDLPA